MLEKNEPTLLVPSCSDRMVAESSGSERRAASESGRNPAEEELEVASAQAWVNAAATWARASEELAWPEMPVGMEPAATVFMPSSERERGQGGRADAMDLDLEVVIVGDDTPPRADVVERTGAD